MTGRASPGKCSPAAAAPAATWTHARLSTWWPPVFVSLDAMPGLRSRYFIDLTGFIKCLDKVAIAVVNSPMLARRLHHSPRRKSFPCILLRTLFRSLRSFSAPRPFFSTTCALFSQNTRVAYLPVSTLTSAPFRLHRHMRRVAPLSPVASVDCAYFPSPRGCAPQTHSLPSVAIEICSPFVFILLQIPFSQ